MSLEEGRGGMRAKWWRAVFYVAVVTAVAAACLPGFPAPIQLLSDKVLHFSAFVLLTVLAILAFPRVWRGMILIGLSCLGLGIELLQATTWIDRTPEGLDLAADVLAIGLTLLFFELGRSLVGTHRRTS